MPTEPTSIPLWAALLGYLIGSIPFGLLLTRAAGMGDVRKIGSGNIGATNVLRTGNKGLAAGTLLLDLLKGLAPVLIAERLGGEVAAAFAAGAAVLGHCFPVWLGFKGGKGVATNAGVAFGLAWPVGLAYAFVWLSVLAIFRISSLAGMAAVVAAAAAAPLFGYPQFFPVLAAIALLIIYLHRANIARLAKGEEPRVGGSKDGAGG
ncbi:MAG: glycerol-3-phosphate 1-O-acyltransferase PlsY [Pseudomonadota bacterium]|uniref:Glycerol-3-phosphate acyltransferase n=1 Tax=Qipengyuania flava TaxID=192812 RepID=A0A3T1CK15_9SPHN|nr:glycerol-3-phosphate 1-O-acyltransferase PlsY [Qipengyuania flava]MEC7741498.1 glycerol-3-phosphate 1-O-acyltransferase PlsY [Pseudomonadota bacterium]MBO9505553.1 glycerol-3-phosphate 1-O-acyltransferase PlsY [Qipengyuania flava]MCA0890893.1 glycerol-3-phosphate 1-O-acyltransferase PlsY [Qipengyuania flava]MEC9150621.1 glycerol-3-phosphate 1-O-acyltransferase PlsY [Pseudomonadota bacterium]MED5206226.1 glycerol-3-phosphate 1-O-acyltransferase PlsY [Pseudomonadota bacterium]